MTGWMRIGEVARRTGLTHRTLRHYDDIGLLRPSGRTDVDYRLYARADLDRLLAIQQLKALGLSLSEIAAALDEGTDAADLLRRHVVAVEQRIAEEQELLAALHRLQEPADTGWHEVLEVIALTQRLQHPDAAVRFRATLTGSGQAPADVLIDLLSDPAAGVREGATWAVARRPGIRDELVSRMLDGDDTTRHSLAHVLGKLRDPGSVGALTVLLADPEVAVAAKAAFSLGRIGGGEAARALIGALGEPRTQVRDEAAAALARIDGALPLLIAALADPSATVREQAADALGMRADEAAAEALATALSDGSAAVAFAALLALGQLRSETATRAIGAAATGGPNERTRLVARRLLADRQAAR